MKKTCSNCVSRFLCPNNYRVCSGWNDEGLFWGFINLNFPLSSESIDRQRAFIKSLQEENGGNDELEKPTLTPSNEVATDTNVGGKGVPSNEPLTCEGCKFEYETTDEAMCKQCKRSPAYRNYCRRPPEGEV